MTSRLFNILLAMALAWPLSAPAADEPSSLNFKGMYEFQFSGVPIGRMGIESEQSDGRYAMTADITTSGIARLFSKHSSHTTVRGAAGSVVYDTRYKTKDKRKSVAMTQSQGEFVKETLVPPDNRDKRPAAPADMKKGAVDPLSLNLALRENAWKAVQSNSPLFSLKVYDGRRLTQVNVTVAGKKVIRLHGKKVSTIRVSVRRKPLAGYTESELADIDPKEPTLWVHYSDDARFVPLYLEMGFLFGKLSASLVKECSAGESCLLGITE